MKKLVNALRPGLPRLLIIGCGDIGLRLLPLLRGRFRLFALTSRPERMADLRAAGAVPLLGNLDHPDSLKRLKNLADLIVHLAPPQASGEIDRRTRNLAAILPDHARLVYVSTTGVYGHCDGALFDETRSTAPQNLRAVRRVDAERCLRAWARRSHGRLSILRVPGIYAADRLPVERLQRGTPALIAADDVYTNHIHADDLARLIRRTLFAGATQRIYHAVDDTELRMADYFDAVADACGQSRPPRLPRAELSRQVTPALLSFMSESRRLMNRRIKKELGFRLAYPTVADFLSSVPLSPSALLPRS